MLSKAKKSQDWCDAVEQLRLEIVEGTALYPETGAATRLDGSSVRAGGGSRSVTVEVPSKGTERSRDHVDANPVLHGGQVPSADLSIDCADRYTDLDRGRFV